MLTCCWTLKSVPAVMRDKISSALCARFSMEFADNRCFFLCLYGDVWRSVWRIVDIVPIDTPASLARFLRDLLWFLLSFSLVDFISFGVLAEQGWPWVEWLTMSPVDSNRLSVCQTNILLIFKVFAMSDAVFPDLNSSTMAVLFCKSCGNLIKTKV